MLEKLSFLYDTILIANMIKRRFTFISSDGYLSIYLWVLSIFYSITNLIVFTGIRFLGPPKYLELSKIQQTFSAIFLFLIIVGGYLLTITFKHARIVDRHIDDIALYSIILFFIFWKYYLYTSGGWPYISITSGIFILFAIFAFLYFFFT